MGTIFEKFNMNGLTAIVTGGAGLLGKQFSKTLAEAQANVIVADLSIEKAKEVAKGLHESGYKALAIQVDVTDKVSVYSMVDEAVDKFGGVNVLVNSAAMDPKFDQDNAGQHNNSFEDYPVEMFREASEAKNKQAPFISS